MSFSEGHIMDNGSERLSAGPNGAQSSPRHGGVPAVHHSRHAAVPAALKQSFNSMGLLKALRRRWLVAFLVGVLCAAGAATGAWYLIPPTKATAFTLLHVHATSPSILFPNAAGQGTPLDIYTRTQSALVRSQMVLGKALEQLPRLSVLEEQSNKIEWLASEIEVDFKTSPEIMRISMSGERPEELAKIVDAVREAYLKEIVFKDSDQRKRRLKDLNNLLESYNGRLDARRKELKALIDGGASTNAKAMALREEGAVQQLHAERQDLLQVQRKLRTARYELSRVLPAMRDPRCVAVSVVLNMTPGIGLPGSLPWGGLGQTLLAEQPAHEEKTAPPVPEALVDAYLKTDPEGAQLLRHEATLTDWIARASEQAVNQNLDYIQERKRQLSETRKQLDALRAKYRPLLGSRISGKAVEDDQAKVAQLQSEIRMWESMEKGLAAEIAQQEGNLHDTSRKSFDLESDRKHRKNGQPDQRRISEVNGGARRASPRAEAPGRDHHPAARRRKATNQEGRHGRRWRLRRGVVRLRLVRVPQTPHRHARRGPRNAGHQGCRLPACDARATLDRPPFGCGYVEQPYDRIGQHAAHHAFARCRGRGPARGHGHQCHGRRRQDLAGRSPGHQSRSGRQAHAPDGLRPAPFRPARALQPAARARRFRAAPRRYHAGPVGHPADSRSRPGAHCGRRLGSDRQRSPGPGQAPRHHAAAPRAVRLYHCRFGPDLARGRFAAGRPARGCLPLLAPAGRQPPAFDSRGRPAAGHAGHP